MDSFLVQNLTNPILTYSKKGGSIDFRGPPNLSNPWSCTKNIWPRGLFNYFLPGSIHRMKMPLLLKKKKKKWRMTGVRRGWDLWQELSLSLPLPLSLSVLPFISASLADSVNSLVALKPMIYRPGSADVSCLALLKYRTLKDFFC